MALDLQVRKWLTVIEEIHQDMGRSDNGPPLKKVAVCAVFKNPYAGQYVQDLSQLTAASEALGEELSRRARAALGEPVESYGKGGMVGTAGDQEHVNSMLTTVFGNILRQHADGGIAWIPSMTKRCTTGAQIDVPVAFKDALYVRSHYDGMTLTIPDAPAPDEIVVIGVYMNRGRINARVGGIPKNEAKCQDGLV